MKWRIKSVFGRQGRNIQSEQQKEKWILKNEESLRNILDNINHNNIRTMGIPQREEGEQGMENLSKNDE